uniref:Uncharacterized protein n=1 Tax=uncultured marine thaumarchaeote KM3_46_G12 TaxID=1456162 RepID=A0A075H3E9_9ARCH|nr:hypothetical protein [uncultured marine thaumarchaeote KM3_46_G12]
MRKPLVLTIVFVFACSITLSSIMAFAQEDYNIPAWIKNNAAWWSEGQIDDASFVSGIKYMIENGIMEISQGDNQVPSGLYEENQRLNSLLTEYQNANDGFVKNEKALHAEINSLKAQLQAAQSANTAGSSSVQKIQDKGDFYVVYVPSDNYSDYVPWVKNGMNNSPQFFDKAVDWLNQTFRLPYDVPIFFHECGVTNAYYDRSAKEIVLCYELIEDYYNKSYFLFSHEGDDYVGYATLGATDYVLYHELAHAFIDIYDLKITGHEEDVADQFSAYMLEEFSGDVKPNISAQPPGTYSLVGQDSIIFAALINKISHSEAHFQPAVFADTHSLNIQRFYNLACYAYGSNPDYSGNIVEYGLLPEHRAQNCEREYNQIVTAWDNLLVQFFK